MTGKQSDIDAIDLVCGAGGLTNGLLQSGISVRACFDMDENCRYPFETNNRIPFICEDIKITSINRINEIFRDSKITLLAGCAPCQPFGDDELHEKNRQIIAEFIKANDFEVQTGHRLRTKEQLDRVNTQMKLSDVLAVSLVSLRYQNQQTH